MRKEIMKGKELKIVAVILLGFIFLGLFSLFLLSGAKEEGSSEEGPEVNIDSIRKETRDSIEAIRVAIKDSIKKAKEEILIDSLWNLESKIKYKNYSLKVILKNNQQTNIILRLPDDYKMTVEDEKIVVKSYHWIWNNEYSEEAREVTDTIIPNVIIVNSIKRL